MKEVLTNGYLKIAPIEAQSFMASQRESYEEIGIVIARDEELCASVPIGSKVYFDSFMAKKYPIEGTDKFQWFVHFGEIVGVF